MSELNFTPIKEDHWLLPCPPGLPYISLTATKRVRDPLPKPTNCPYCGAAVKLVNNREIYGKSIGDWPFAYHCQGCGESYVGVHPDTDIPVGIMADKQLRKARQVAKQSFHDMMDKRGITRADAYQWLAVKMEIPLNETHFGWFDTAACLKALQFTQEAINNVQ